MNTSYACAVTRHGKKQLEIQLTCALPESGRKTTYQIGVYLLFPRSMHMNGQRYGEAQFLQDTLSYTRFTTPGLSLRHVLDPANTKSPLARLLYLLRTPATPRDLDEARVEYELRTLVNIFQSRAKETVGMIRRNLAAGANVPDAVFLTDLLLKETEGVLRIFRDEVRPHFLEARMPANLRNAADCAEDAMGISLLKQFHTLCFLSRNHEGMRALRQSLLDRIRAECEQRKRRAYPCPVPGDPPEVLEAYLHHESELKKWAQQTYYMTQQRDRSVRHVTSFFMALAAMLAMTFAVAVTFVASTYFPVNSVPLALALVISYAFKDRIKESMRAFFLHLLPRMVSDRRDKLISPDKRKVGASRLRVGFGGEEGLSPEVRTLLKLSAQGSEFPLPARDVVQFHKRIHLRSLSLRKVYSRLESITEILRFRMDDWLVHMDEPLERIRLLEEGDSKLVKVNRTYPVKMVLHLSQSGSKDAEIYAYDLHMNRKGIVRVASQDRGRNGFGLFPPVG